MIPEVVRKAEVPAIGVVDEYPRGDPAVGKEAETQRILGAEEPGLRDIGAQRPRRGQERVGADVGRNFLVAVVERRVQSVREQVAQTTVQQELSAAADPV